MTVTVRMRVAPPPVQLQLDALSYIDVLRVQNSATGATSFFEFSLAVLRMTEINGQGTGPEMIKNLDSLEITYKGKGVCRSGAYSILAIVASWIKVLVRMPSDTWSSSVPAYSRILRRSRAGSRC